MTYDARDDFWVKEGIQKIRNFDGEVFKDLKKLHKEFRVAFLHELTEDAGDLCVRLADLAEKTMLSGKSFEQMFENENEVVQAVYDLVDEMDQKHFSDFFIFDSFLSEHFWTKEQYEKMGYNTINQLEGVCTILWYLKEWLGIGEEGDLFDKEQERIKDLNEVYEEADKDLDALKDFDYGYDVYPDYEEHRLRARDVLPDYVFRR